MGKMFFTASCIALVAVSTQAQTRLKSPPGLENVIRIELPPGADLAPSAETLEFLRALRENAEQVENVDPPGLLTEEQLGPIAALAARLSSDRSWLLPEVLAAMARQRLRLDEIFAAAPELLVIEDAKYRIMLEKLGSGWETFNAGSDPFFVFLNHEVYDGLGEDRALAFQDGHETVIFEDDLKNSPIIGLTLAGLSPDERPRLSDSVLPLGQPIALGEIQPRLERGLEHRFHGFTATSSCAEEVAPSACSGGVPVCSAGYSPYFVLSGILFKTDHEGAFRGKPEIELFPVQLDTSSPAGGTNATTDFMFKGISVTDIAGRSRFLPDSNSTWTWHNVSGGLALFPLDMSNEWGMTLVEDDDEPGVMKLDKTRVNTTSGPYSLNRKHGEFFGRDLCKSTLRVWRFCCRAGCSA